MKNIRKVIAVSSVLFFINNNMLQGGMIEQVLYNVVGQVSNAIGARLGDEIYYGSSNRGAQVSSRVYHRKTSYHRHKTKRKHKRKKVVKKVKAPKVIMTDEKRIQIALKSLGFYKGEIDGEINSFETRDAIKKLNIAYGISQGAFLNPKVKDNLIYLGSLFDIDRKLIAKGKDKKTKIAKIQAALKVNGFYSAKIDGISGKGTRNAIAKYKKANNLSAGNKLNFEEEYRLISSAKVANEKNIESTIASLKAIGLNNKGQYNQVAKNTLNYQEKINSNQSTNMQQNSIQNQNTNTTINNSVNNTNNQLPQKNDIQQNTKTNKEVEPRTDFAYRMLSKIKKESNITTQQKSTLVQKQKIADKQINKQNNLKPISNKTEITKSKQTVANNKQTIEDNKTISSKDSASNLKDKINNPKVAQIINEITKE